MSKHTAFIVALSASTAISVVVHLIIWIGRWVPPMPVSYVLHALAGGAAALGVMTSVRPATPPPWSKTDLFAAAFGPAPRWMLCGLIALLWYSALCLGQVAMQPKGSLDQPFALAKLFSSSWVLMHFSTLSTAVVARSAYESASPASAGADDVRAATSGP